MNDNSNQKDEEELFECDMAFDSLITTREAFWREIVLRTINQIKLANNSSLSIKITATLSVEMADKILKQFDERFRKSVESDS